MMHYYHKFQQAIGLHDDYLSRQLWELMRKEWPQLNEMTKFEIVRHYPVIFQRPLDQSVPSYNLVPVDSWLPVSGLRNLLYVWLYFHKGLHLDNLETRLMYQAAVWSSLLMLPVPALWRLLGRVFDRRDWYLRGMKSHRTWERRQVVKVQDEVIEMKAFGYQFGYQTFSENSVHIRCGYSKLGDTLYIYRSRL